MIMLHGFTDNGMCWLRVASVLEEKFDIILPDIRGHGKSIAKELDFSLETMSEDIVNLINTLSLEKTILMGHSMGAQIASLIAANHPNLISKIILEDPAYIFNPKSFKARFLVIIFKFLIKRNMKKTEEKLRKSSKRINSKWDIMDHETWASGQKDYSVNDPITVFENLKISVDWHETFQKIKVPVLIIVSTKGILREKEAESIISEFGDAKIAVVKDAGHNIRRDNFNDFISHVESFLETSKT
jgi:N-formylmaleamate deformylase